MRRDGATRSWVVVSDDLKDVGAAADSPCEHASSAVTLATRALGVASRPPTPAAATEIAEPRRGVSRPADGPEPSAETRARRTGAGARPVTGLAQPTAAGRPPASELERGCHSRSRRAPPAAGRPSGRYILELFAGSGAVSAALRAKGGRVSVPIHVRQGRRHDLTDACVQSVVLGWILSRRIAGVFLAPPCTPWSTARTTGRPPAATARGFA